MDQHITFEVAPDDAEASADAGRGELEALHEQYMLHFAGQPRLTRDVDMLDYLIEAVQGLQARLDVSAYCRDQAAAQAETYRTERQAITQAVAAAGPHGRLAAQVLGRAELAVHRYQRHFAGRARFGRDVGLLGEIDSALSSSLASLRALGFASREVDALAQQVILIHQELEAMRLFLDSGDAAHQAAAWASLANSLFEVYQGQFFERSRLTCRLSLAHRLCDTLAAVRERLSTVYPPTDVPPHHQTNVHAVDNELAAWRMELEHIAAVQRACTPEEQATALNSAAEEVLEIYNTRLVGVQHDAVDLAELRGLCDRLDELEQQMTALESTPGLGDHGHNVAMTRDALTMLNGLYDLVVRDRPPVEHPAH